MFDYNSTLFWYRFVFLFELIFCEFLFVYKLKKRNNFYIKLIICVISSFLLTSLIPIPFYNWIYTSFMFLLIYVFTLISLFILFEEKGMVILFCSIAGYTTQHMCFQTFSLLNTITSSSTGPEYNIYGSRIPQDPISFTMDVIIYIVIFISITSLIWLLLARKIKQNKDVIIHRPMVVILTLVFVLVSVILNAISTYNSYIDYSQIDLIISSILSIIICVLSLGMQFLSSNQINLKNQLEIANHIIHEGNKQFQQSKQNIELMNIKCHDLKHQIKNLINQKVDEKELKEITSIINVYDSSIKTGNDVLDIVLTQKTLECNTKDICLTCLINGKLLNFMQETDIYSLFGNALDNSIEASLQVNENKRIISLTSSEKNNLLFVTLKNYTKNEPIFIDNLPQTTKDDKNYHGFGSKSIKRIVEKYNGTIHYFYDKEIFTLSIIFELDNTTPKQENIIF